MKPTTKPQQAGNIQTPTATSFTTTSTSRRESEEEEDHPSTEKTSLLNPDENHVQDADVHDTADVIIVVPTKPKEYGSNASPKGLNNDDESTPLQQGQKKNEKDEDAPMSIAAILKEEIGHLKWRVLIIACFYGFGLYYVFDFPGAIGIGAHHTIESRFYDHHKEYTQEMNQLLYSVYSWPNTVLAIFGGLLIDKYLGLRKSILLFGFLTLTGQAVFYLGVQTINFDLMVTGRVIFGLGGESQYVSLSTFLTRWFKSGRGMALAFGIVVAFCRFGSSLTFMLSPSIAQQHDAAIAVLVGTIVCCVSFTAGIMLVLLDLYGEKHKLVPRQGHAVIESSEPTSPASDAESPTSPVYEPPPPPPVGFSDLRKGIKLTTIIIFFICIFSYGAMTPFTNIASNYFQRKYDVSNDTGSRYVSYFQDAACVCSPVFGFLIDSTGRFVYWMIGGSFGFAMIHVLFLTLPTSVPPQVLMALFGLIYSALAQSLWPAVPYTVPGNIVGITFGVMTALQNLGLAIFPLIIGAVLDHYTSSSSAHPVPTIATPTHHPNTTTATLRHVSFHIQQLLLAAADSDDISSSDNTGGGDTPPPTQPPAPIPSLDGFKVTEMIFIGLASVATVLAVVVLIMDKRTKHKLLSSSAQQRKKQLDAMLQESGGDSSLPRVGSDSQVSFGNNSFY